MNKIAIGALLLSVFAASCEDPAANKPKAVTADASNAATAVRESSERTEKGTKLSINPENSKVGFVGSKVTGKHDGGFKAFTGTIDLVGEKPEDSTVAIDIQMNSVFTDADGLTSHLQTGDFFEVEKFPSSTFKSTAIAPDEAKGAGNYIVTGDLEMRGQKKSIKFPAAITVEADAVSVNAEFAINRKDFGIVYAGKADDLIRDDVVIRLDLKAPRK
ncbi:MAG: YceI family protein [Pyrinomonadaceae bacterium]